MKIVSLVLVAALALASQANALGLKERLNRRGQRISSALDKPRASVKTTHFDSVDPVTGAHLTTVQHASHVQDSEDPSDRHVTLGTHMNYKDPKVAIDKTVQTQHTSFTDKASNAKIERTQSTNTVSQVAANKNMNQVHRIIHTQRIGSSGEVLHLTEDIIRTQTVERLNGDEAEYMSAEYFDTVDQEYDGTHMLPPVDPLVNTFEQAVAGAPQAPAVPEVPDVASIGTDGEEVEGEPEFYYSADAPESYPVAQEGGAEAYHETSVSVVEESMMVVVSGPTSGQAVQFPEEALADGSETQTPTMVAEGSLAAGAYENGEVVMSGDHMVVAGNSGDHVTPRMVESVDGGDESVHAEIIGSVAGSENEADAEEFFTYTPEDQHPVMVNEGAQLGEVTMVHASNHGDFIVPTTVHSVGSCREIAVSCSEVPQARVTGDSLVKAGVWKDKKKTKHSKAVELDVEQTEYMHSEYVSALLHPARPDSNGEEKEDDSSEDSGDSNEDSESSAEESSSSEESK